jgi:hypothetical protein
MKKPYPARAAGSATPKVPTKPAVKPTAKPTAKPAVKPRAATTVMKTTKTPDGGQQYVRNNDYKVAGAQSKAYEKRAYAGKTVNPKAAESLAKAEYYALDPSDGRMAKDMGKYSREYAEKVNAITRKYGADKRR